MFRPAHNTTDTPVLIDDAGRQLGGREWGPVDTRTDEVKAGVDAGTLVVFDPAKVTDDAISEAVDARRAAEARQVRHDALDALDADDVRKVAEAADVALTAPMVDDDGRPAEDRRRHARELVAELVYHPDPLEDLLERAAVSPATPDASSTSTASTSAGEPVASSTDDTSTGPAKATAPAKAAAAARKSAPTIPTPEA